MRLVFTESAWQDYLLFQEKDRQLLKRMNTADEILAKIISWAENEKPIRALILVGSRAQETSPDELADFDISVFGETYEPYTRDDEWLSRIGEVWVWIPEKYHRGDEVVPTRLVIFRDGVKVDFSFLKLDVLNELRHSDELDSGYKVLLDKDGTTKRIKKPTFRGFRHAPPSQEDFVNLVREFWFEAYHVAKYLKREELWLVKFRDWTTKELLLRMIEWHEQAKHRWNHETYYMGKHLKSWADVGIWEKLHEAFARFDCADSWNGLLATTQLFRQLASETAQMGGFSYPQDVDRNIAGFITGLKEGL